MENYPYTTNYSGRQVDIELLQSITKPVKLKKVNVSNVSETPKIVTGIEKLAQRYTLLFLSTLGSIHFDTDQGTELVGQLLGGVIQNRGNLESAFAVANNLVMQQFEKDDLKTDIYGEIQDDENLDDVKLLDFDIEQATGTIYLQIQLITVAGDDITFIVPTSAPR